uniref:Uncharacterized protein n=1 Tax=viral metagenome TaxID=1070528 RepID=A0A6M3LMI0_9ZZZZ
MYTGGDVSTYKTRHGSRYTREDADGRVHIMAHAGASATANVPKVLTLYSSASNPLVGIGYFATAAYATGLASATAAQQQTQYVGIPANQVPSDTDGWFQIAGPFIGVALGSSLDNYINCAIKWTGTSFVCSSSGAFRAGSVTDSTINSFAVSLSSVSQGTYDWYLFGNTICGMT